MLIAVLAFTMTAATLMATAVGLYEETRRDRAHVEAEPMRAFRTARRFSVNPRDR